MTDTPRSKRLGDGPRVNPIERSERPSASVPFVHLDGISIRIQSGLDPLFTPVMSFPFHGIVASFPIPPALFQDEDNPPEDVITRLLGTLFTSRLLPPTVATTNFLAPATTTKINR